MKKVILLLICGFCSICSFSQGELGLTIGANQDIYDSDYIGNMTEYDGAGFNLILNYENSFSKRFGFDAGMEYSKSKIYSDEFFKKFGSFIPNPDNFSRRFGAKFGFFYTPIQRNKWTWRLAILSNFYYDLQGKGIGTLGTNQFDEFGFGTTIMNKIKYRVTEDILIVAAQSFDIYENFSGDQNRVNFNFGVAYIFK